MGDSNPASILILGVGMLLTGMLVREVTRRLRSFAAVGGFCVGLLLAGASAIWFVDVNVPLQASHWRPSGLAAPAWIAFLAGSLRFGALAGLIVLARQLSARAQKSMK